MKEKRILQICVALVLVCAIAFGGVQVYQLWQNTRLQREMLAELDGSSGSYDPSSIVLRDTSKAEAEELAELLGARLRITEDGSFAALYLPEGVTIRDVVADKENREILSQLSIDYQVQVSELEDEETGMACMFFIV